MRRISREGNPEPKMYKARIYHNVLLENRFFFCGFTAFGLQGFGILCESVLAGMELCLQKPL